MSKKETKAPVQDAVLKFNDKEYKIADLPDDAKAQIQNLRYSEAEMQRLNMQLAIVTTARNAYQRALTELLPKD